MDRPSQQLLLMDDLRSNGWQVTAETRDLPWWADEVWTIESIWRPVGLQAFVTFEVDPEVFSHKRKPGTSISGVHCTRAWPEGCTQGDTIVHVSWNHWDKQLPELIQSLSRFRDDAA